MMPGFTSDYHKQAYVVAPVKAIAHPCPVCKQKACTCGKSCGVPAGICQAVVDDANGRVFLYGNVVHENYHAPSGECLAFTTVPAAEFFIGSADELFEGEQDNNNVTLAHRPFQDNSLLVFLNGVKQVAGPERDYVVDGNKIHFNFYDIIHTDRIEVMYRYGEE